MSSEDHFDTERFIAEIEVRRGLWDTSSSDYSNKDVKRQLWVELTNIFGGENLEEKEKAALGALLEKKWKNITDSFQGELQRFKGVKSDSSYTYFNLLQFLTPIIENNPTASSLRDSPQSSETNNDGDTRLIPPPQLENIQPLRSKRKRGSDCDDLGAQALVSVLKESIDYREKRDAQNDSDCDRMFLLSMLDDFRNIPSAAKMRARIELMKIVDRYQPNRLQSERFNQDSSSSQQMQSSDSEVSQQSEILDLFPSSN